MFSLGFLIGFLVSYLINWYIKKEKKEVYNIRKQILIAVIVGVLFLINYLVFSLSLNFLYTSILVILFVIISFVDIKCYVIPDSINLIILLFSLVLVIFYKKNLWIDIIDIYGVIIFNILLLLVIILIYKIRKVEILGFGDIKFLFSIGVLFGLTNFSYALVVSSLVAVFVEVIILSKKRTYIPYGPYLTFGFLLIWFIFLK